MARSMLFLLSLLLLPSAAPAAEPGSVGQGLIDLMKGRDHSIQEIVRSETKGESPEERIRLKEIVGDSFDFEEFARLSLGRSWGDRTESERVEFVGLCRRLIELNYGDPKLYTKSDKIDYMDGTADGDEAVVKTVVHYKGEQSAIDYLFHRVGSIAAGENTESRWLIYDMAIDDLRVSRNNRSQFSKEIRTAGYEGLVGKLRDKLAKDEQRDDGDGR